MAIFFFRIHSAERGRRPDDPPRRDNTRTDKRTFKEERTRVAFEESASPPPRVSLLFVKSHSTAIQLTKSSAYVTLSDCW